METRSSTALLTDHYELTMLQASLKDGTAHKKAVFEVFARKLPQGRRFGVVGGIGRIVEAVEKFQFTQPVLDFLKTQGFLNDETLAYLKDYKFSGKIISYQEGELYFPYSPVLTVEATFGEAVVLETLILSILNHDSAVASAAGRMLIAAAGLPIMEMGARRTHEEAAVSAARVACLLGFSSTSNLEAGFRYGVLTKGTSAHAYTLAHVDGVDTSAAELDAFEKQVDALGVSTTLLVDTFDIAEGIKNAVKAAGTGLGAIRIDSGDLLEEVKKARVLLDSLGATNTKIVVSSDLDEFSIAKLVEAKAPVDSFGVGTRLVTGSGHPTASFVYKLVAIENKAGLLAPVAKRASGKISLGGKKYAWRTLDADGKAHEERVVVRTVEPIVADTSDSRYLQVTLFDKGVNVYKPINVKEFFWAVLSELRPMETSLDAGLPSLAAKLR